MRLIHTLLFLLRKDNAPEDLKMADTLLRSLEKSTSKTVVVYNQGYLTNEALAQYLSKFQLDAHVIGEGTNDGIPVGRQRCFSYIWSNYPDTEYISELHLDMCLSSNWEEPLVDYLASHDDPVICSGIIDQNGEMPMIDKKVSLPQQLNQLDDFLLRLREDKVLSGFTHPCIHISPILKEIGGYNLAFLKGKQCFEDDSLLLGYYYYCGTKANWRPKVNYNSVAYHAVAGQRLSIYDNIQVNYNGLVRQYGGMGLKHLAHLHGSPWHQSFFESRYRELSGVE